MKNIFKFMIIGLIIGLISGMFASGGGLLLIPLLSHFCHLSEKKARGTAICCTLPMVIASIFFYHSNNFIDYRIGLLCGIGGLLGGFVGANILKKTNNKYLKIIFSIFLVFIGIKIIFS